jgi:SPOR domain
MADRYSDRPFPTQESYDRGHDRGVNPSASHQAESDPLAELARLIGQTDPFAAAGKPPHPLQSRANVRPHYQPPVEEEEVAPAGPPPWMQRTRHEPAQQEPEEPEYQQHNPVHPLQRYAAHHAAPAQEYAEELPYAEPEREPDPSRYDDALYGQITSGEQEFQREPAYPDDPYAYQSGYEEDEPTPHKRGRSLMTVVAVLALAVVGTGAAFAYRTYVGSPRSGEPPIIRADNSPTKIVPAPAEAIVKTPDRLVQGDGAEKLVSREESPVDINARSGPRVVFPPLNSNGSSPPVASVNTSAPPAAAPNGTMPNNEPRKVRTLAVRGDPADAGLPPGAAPPPARPAPAARSSVPPPPAPAPRNPSSANASANGPLSLSPETAPPDPTPPATRVASTNPAPAASGGGQYLVQLSSQKTEADAAASYRALQGKFPAVLGSRQAVIRRADLGEKGIYYRAMVGPFGSSDEATQFCVSLKSAGGQCFVPRN